MRKEPTVYRLTTATRRTWTRTKKRGIVVSTMRWAIYVVKNQSDLCPLLPGNGPLESLMAFAYLDTFGSSRQQRGGFNSTSGRTENWMTSQPGGQSAISLWPIHRPTSGLAGWWAPLVGSVQCMLPHTVQSQVNSVHSITGSSPGQLLWPIHWWYCFTVMPHNHENICQDFMSPLNLGELLNLRVVFYILFTLAVQWCGVLWL